MARLPIGARIRARRQDLGLTQAALASDVAISGSYLNLIEHDKRPIGGALLRRIADRLSVDVGFLSGADHARLAQDLQEIARTLPDSDLPAEAALAVVAQFPAWAEAFVRLHRRYRDAAETAAALSDRLGQDPALVDLSHTMLGQITAIRSFAEILDSHADLPADRRARFSSIIAEQSGRLAEAARQMLGVLGGSGSDPALPGTPLEEVNDFLIHHRNHFPALESACEALGADLAAGVPARVDAMASRLADRHGVRIGHGADPAAADLDGDRLRVPEGATEAAVRFRLAQALVRRELAGLLWDLCDDPRLTGPESRTAAVEALARYGAAALRFPYAPFHQAAESMRYDIDRLAARFGGSFEQVAHRLVSLRRPGAEGVPFAFLRADPAGNLSKPFSISGLRMPRVGGTCPLWPLHTAFAEPARTVAELVEMPDGERYVFVARQVTRGLQPGGEPASRYSVMLGCDAAYRDRLVYGDAIGAGERARPRSVGFTCRSCRRRGCAQRANPWVGTDPTSGDSRTAETMAIC